MSESKIGAGVVSFNRIELLKRSLQAIFDTPNVAEIVVVDNGSTDGSREYLATIRDPRLRLILSKQNDGGAGGFAKALAWLIAGKTDYFWLMDDDAIPNDGCAATLARVLDDNPELTFVAPRVVDYSGETGPRNFPLLAIDDIPTVYEAVAQACLPIATASFVGPMIRRTAAMSTHAPMRDYFIWHDDYEFTSRLSSLGPAWSVPSATIEHAITNIGPEGYLASRNFYNFRNMAWWLKTGSHLTLTQRRWLRKLVVKRLMDQFRQAPRKMEFLQTSGTAFAHALRRTPRIETYDEILHESRSADLVFP